MRAERFGHAPVEQAPTSQAERVVHDVTQAGVAEVVAQFAVLLGRDLPNEAAPAELLERRDRLLVAATRREPQCLEIK